MAQSRRRGGARKTVRARWLQPGDRDIFDAWEHARFDIERLIDRGEDVVALGQVRGLGRATGMEVDRPHGQIWTFRDGRVTRMRWFHSHRETLEAVELAE
jgi:ketosteroid isomerase-like protein